MATRKKYQLEGMVKDSTVAAALSRALDGDGKLSYDELLVIIYSACDGNSITEQEVKDKKFHRVERFYGAFSRSLSLPDYVDAAKISAAYKDGVLEITLPKTEKAKPQQIKVEVK